MMCELNEKNVILNVIHVKHVSLTVTFLKSNFLLIYNFRKFYNYTYDKGTRKIVHGEGMRC